MNRRFVFTDRARSLRAALAGSVLGLSLLLGGCQEEVTRSSSNRGQIPLSQAVLAELEGKGMTKASPVLMRIFKQESELEVWKLTAAGRYEHFKTYPICKWSGELGPKVREGDRQAPEGFYNITPALMNPNSSYFLSFNMGFPNQFDRAYGRSGSHLMVHGDCSSRGCYAMSDPHIAEIYALAREALSAGQPSFQVQAYPFRMTAKNLARHRANPNMAFWKNLKEGNDHFMVTKAEPKTDVCERRYVFNAVAPGADGASPVEMAAQQDAWGNLRRPGSSASTVKTTTTAATPLPSPGVSTTLGSGAVAPKEKRMAVPASTKLAFSAADKCPTFAVPSAIAQAVNAKHHQDMQEVAQLVGSGIEQAPVKTGRDGGQHESFAYAGLGASQSVRGEQPSLPVAAPAAVADPVTTQSATARTPATNRALGAAPAASAGSTTVVRTQGPSATTPAPAAVSQAAPAASEPQKSSGLFGSLPGSGLLGSLIGSKTDEAAATAPAASEPAPATAAAPVPVPSPRKKI